MHAFGRHVALLARHARQGVRVLVMEDPSFSVVTNQPVWTYPVLLGTRFCHVYTDRFCMPTILRLFAEEEYAEDHMTRVTVGIYVCRGHWAFGAILRVPGPPATRSIPTVYSGFSQQPYVAVALLLVIVTERQIEPTVAVIVRRSQLHRTLVGPRLAQSGRHVYVHDL